MSNNIFYVYQYLREDGTPYYIGKGSKNRINESHNPWIMLPPKEYRKVIKDNLTEKEAFNLEIELIKLYGRKRDGGLLENTKLSRWTTQSGKTHSQETKEKISRANKGKVRLESQKINYRKPKSAEHIEKIRLANLGRPSDIERNLKIKEKMKNKRWFTNGDKSVFCEPGLEPNGYYPGRIIIKGTKNVLA